MKKTCSLCVLDESYPGIRFNDTGICKFCAPSKKVCEKKESKLKYEQQFRRLIEDSRAVHDYDCLVAFSGGKDSTFTMHLLQTKFKLKILAFSFDNWYQSETAHKNIRNVIKNIGVDHIFFKPKFEVYKKILQVCVAKNFIPMTAMTRASAICTTCLSMIRFLALKIAIEKAIPIVVFGLSPGQAPIATSIFKSNPLMIEKMQKAICASLDKAVGSDVKQYFLNKSHYENKENFPHIVNPLAFFNYDEKTIFKTIANYGWIKPSDTDSNSTNCLLNGVANEIHLEQFGFNPYAFEIAGLVRNNCMSREEGLKRLNTEADPELISKIRLELEI